jgi:hypothetical protein
MTIRRVASIIVRTIAGLGSLLVSLYGLYSYSGLNVSLDAVPMTLFCLLPMLSFPVFLLSFWRRRLSVAVLWAFALLYLIVYSMLNWRTCAEMGYCTSVASTVLQTLAVFPVELTFAAATINLCALLFSSKARLKPQ